METRNPGDRIRVSQRWYSGYVIPDHEAHVGTPSLEPEAAPSALKGGNMPLNDRRFDVLRFWFAVFYLKGLDHNRKYKRMPRGAGENEYA